jgi:hypothetical protein
LHELVELMIGQPLPLPSRISPTPARSATAK